MLTLTCVNLSLQFIRNKSSLKTILLSKVGLRIPTPIVQSLVKPTNLCLMVVKLTKPMCKTQIIITVKHCWSIQTVFIVSQMQTDSNKKKSLHPRGSKPIYTSILLVVSIAQRPYSCSLPPRPCPKTQTAPLVSKREEKHTPTASHAGTSRKFIAGKVHMWTLGSSFYLKIFDWSKVRHMFGSYTNPHLHAAQLWRLLQ